MKTPLFKGVITGIIMVAITLVLFYREVPADTGFQYLVHAVYAGGIIWALLAYRSSPAFTGRFKDMFSQGFRCFSVATLIFVCFTGIFTKMHPEFAEEAGQQYKEHLVSEKKHLPNEIDERVASFKNSYTVALISTYIFGYLILGAVVTAVAAIFLNRRN